MLCSVTLPIVVESHSSTKSSLLCYRGKGIDRARNLVKRDVGSGNGDRQPYHGGDH